MNYGSTRKDNFSKTLENIKLLYIPSKFSKINRNFERVFENLTLKNLQNKLTKNVKYNFFNNHEIELLGVTPKESR
jgi:hypothetical protein